MATNLGGFYRPKLAQFTTTKPPELRNTGSQEALYKTDRTIGPTYRGRNRQFTTPLSQVSSLNNLQLTTRTDNLGQSTETETNGLSKVRKIHTNPLSEIIKIHEIALKFDKIQEI